MDRYFKILRAREEIKRLNIEIRRVVTWIRDENRFLRKIKKTLRATAGKSEEEIELETQMSVQVRLYRERRGRFDAGHLERFQKLAQMPGFTGTLQSGVAVEHQEVRRRLRELREELAAQGRGDDMGDYDDAEHREMEVRMREVRAELAGEDGEDGMWVDEVAEETGDDDEGDDAREEAISGLLYQISMLAVDDRVRGGEDNE
ncbi:hypothetical protein K438DRAFT_1972968 [Mycena galopus ATCC 62051]|nr:hypothetical protein K438DRAFT_1972968 [Mycena galopus ATCC 62051]